MSAMYDLCRTRIKPEKDEENFRPAYPVWSAEVAAKVRRQSCLANVVAIAPATQVNLAWLDS